MTEIREPRPDDRPDAPASSGTEERGAAPRRSRRRRRRRHLPVATRVWFWIAGALLVALGIAGLFLPFLQGILFLVLAAAILSLASETVYHWLEGLVAERWPELWRRIERLHTRLHWRFRRRTRKPADGETEEAAERKNGD